MDSMLNMVAEAVVMEITLEVLSLVQAVVAAAPRAVGTSREYGCADGGGGGARASVGGAGGAGGAPGGGGGAGGGTDNPSNSGGAGGAGALGAVRIYSW